MTADELEALLKRIAHPAVAGDLTEVITALVPRARQFHRSGNLAALADLCKTLSERAWKLRLRELTFRFLVAERALAMALHDWQREQEVTRYLAARNRLSERFQIAEAWNHRLLRSELNELTAVTHATAWRELAAIREVAAAYGEGIGYCETAMTICRTYADVPGMSSAQVKAVLEKSVLHRLSGDLEAARTALLTARGIVERTKVDPLLRGLVPLREGGLEFVAGRPAPAFEAYRRAERAFAGVSGNNGFIARIRQVTCLSRLDGRATSRGCTGRRRGRTHHRDRSRGCPEPTALVPGRHA